MRSDVPRKFQAGDPVEDLCRVCKTVRAHTVIVADRDGGILRVICDYCGSQHNYRSGRTPESTSGDQIGAATGEFVERGPTPGAVSAAGQEGGETGLEALLRRIIREETGLTPVSIADKWRGGELILKPAKPGLQEKIWPIETFFHKVVMLRNRLRVLEQQINGADLPEDLKVKLQGYITGCYGTLTSFNVLFAEEEDRFHGASGQE
jgi:hypothetical protein